MKRIAVFVALALAILIQVPAFSAEKLPWTITGVEGGTVKALMMADGTVQPFPGAFNVSFWISHPDIPEVVMPERLLGVGGLRWKLTNGYLPIPTMNWHAGEISVMSRLYARSYGPTEDKSVCFAQVKLTNSGSAVKKLTLYAVIRPASGKTMTASYDKKLQAVVIDGKLGVVPQIAPEGFEISNDKTGKVWESELKYTVSLAPKETVSYAFKMPMQPKAPSAEYVKIFKSADSNQALINTIAYWEKRVNNTGMSLPDARYSDAFKASVAYLLLNMRGDRLYAGPLTKEFRYRDATYMAYALDMAGHVDMATKALRSFVEFQQPDGSFPAYVDARGKPVGPRSYDAQGQALFALGRHYRYSRDRKWLESVFPSIVKGGKYLVELRKKAEAIHTDRTPEDGLLPAGVSDPNLGKEPLVRYWDNCWAVGGLYEAMWAATFLNKDEPRNLFGENGNDMVSSLTSSYLRVRIKHNLYWVPNATKEIYSNAAVQSATPGIWPCRAFNFMDPMVNQSFLTYYWKKWIHPNGGGFFLNDTKFLPHVSLGLAHSYVYYDHPEMAMPVVEFALVNQTGDGVYAWAEGADKATKAPIGDMPSGWAAAEYINVLRDMLVREEREGLTLFSAVPSSWLDDGKVISFKNLPTYWGKFGMTLTSHAKDNYVTIKFTGDAEPPAGFLFRWPMERKQMRGVYVDGQIYTRFSGTAMSLPGDAREIRIEF